MDSRVKQFRKIRHRVRHGRRSGAAPYPGEAKAIARELADERGLAASESVELARELGVAPQTLKEWLSRAPISELRRVHLTGGGGDDDSGQRGEQRACSSVEEGGACRSASSAAAAVVLPGGIRVEGLDLEAVVELVRRLM